jgi:chitinase
VTLTASASDPESRLSRVDFYRGSTLLGTDTTAPYTFTWSSVPAGSYVLTAIAIDADGGSATSAAVNIGVNPPPSTTSIAFTASADHDAGVTGYSLEVFANGADPNSSTPIASKNLGKPAPDGNREIVLDETAFFNALAHGTYTVTVGAIGSEGPARSTPVTYSR